MLERLARTGPTLVVLLAMVVWPDVAHAAAKRPPPLADQDGCEHYRGTSSGNDPSVRLDVLICPHEDGTAGKVQGQVQWSSTLSGWNLRDIDGSWSGDALKLRDLAITEQKPESGFRFCTIDVYALKQESDGKLSGTYDSEACDDHATLELTPLEPVKPAGEAAPKAPEPSKPEPSKPEPTEAPATKPKPKPDSVGGCNCSVAPLMVVPLLGLRRRRYRRPRDGSSLPE